MAAASVEDVKKYDLLLLGSSTWGSGELQDDWPGFLDKLGKEDLSGRRVALFGCGDAGIYSDTFCDAMAEIRDGLASTGCTFVGGFDAEEYPGCGSRLCQDGEAIGWAVDDSASDARTRCGWSWWIGRHRLKPNAMSAGDFSRYDNMKMLLHHIYESVRAVRESGALHAVPDLCRAADRTASQSGYRLSVAAGNGAEGQSLFRQA